MRFKRILILMIICFAVNAAVSWAAVSRVNINQYLCQQAELILRGTIERVDRISLMRLPSSNIIASVGRKNTLRIEKIYKGQVTANTVQILTQGGILPDNIELQVAHEPVFSKGQQVLVFLNKRLNGPFYYEVWLKDQGQFIVHDEDELKKLEKQLSRFVYFENK